MECFTLPYKIFAMAATAMLLISYENIPRQSVFKQRLIRATKKKHLEAVGRNCFVKKVFLAVLQNSQENTCARASFSIKLQAEARPS